jgi:hypothetical protein
VLMLGVKKRDSGLNASDVVCSNVCADNQTGNVEIVVSNRRIFMFLVDLFFHAGEVGLLVDMFIVRIIIIISLI